MKYEDLLKDVEKLIGLKLYSIRPGSDLKVKDLDRENNRLKIETRTGEIKTRPLAELEKIWEELCEKGVVRVEDVLGGSGSSRNQPETIFANLPYIEWLRIENKKHIAIVGKASHDYGTILQMDPVQAERLKNKMLSSNEEGITCINAVVVTKDIVSSVSSIEKATGTKVKPVVPGVYVHEYNNNRVLIVSYDLAEPPVEKGTYIVKNVNLLSNSLPEVKINNVKYHVSCTTDVKLLLQVVKSS